SKVIAIGIMKDEKYNIYLEQNYTEKEMLELFWSELDHSLKESHNTFYVVGFNILQFDLPFLITRSFIHNVKVCANLNQKIICDIKDRLSYTRKGYVRGKLKEFASLLGMSILPYDGRVINKLYVNQDWDSIRDYLKKDLEITNELFKRLLSTGIFDMTSR
ncbi:MAG: hypothetical protein N3E37_05415, partial [Candidatus Micrarchaeota archaeon]|nr:hypothetical protein [Candidatus Micrarchaeota archaeon]